MCIKRNKANFIWQTEGKTGQPMVYALEIVAVFGRKCDGFIERLKKFLQVRISKELE